MMMQIAWGSAAILACIHVSYQCSEYCCSRLFCSFLPFDLCLSDHAFIFRLFLPLPLAQCDIVFCVSVLLRLMVIRRHGDDNFASSTSTWCCVCVGVLPFIT